MKFADLLKKKQGKLDAEMIAPRNRTEAREALRQSGTRRERKTVFGRWRDFHPVTASLRVSRIADLEMRQR